MTTIEATKYGCPDGCTTDHAADERAGEPSDYHKKELGSGLSVVHFEGKTFVNWIPDWTDWLVEGDEIDTAYREVRDALRKVKREFAKFEEHFKRGALTADRALAQEIAVMVADRGWTFDELWSRSGLDASLLGELLAGKSPWTVSELRRVGRAFDGDGDGDSWARLLKVHMSVEDAR